MTLGQKLRQLRQLEGELRGLGRELTQSELVRAIRTELGESISQSYLSLIEKGARKHLSHESRELLPRFFKVHPGYLVSDPPGFHTELHSEASTAEPALDRWLGDGAARFAHDPDLAAALERVAMHAETRRCLILLGEMIAMPGLIDHLSETLWPEARKSTGRRFFWAVSSSGSCSAWCRSRSAWSTRTCTSRGRATCRWV